MGRLRVLSGEKVCAILVRHGFREVRRRGDTSTLAEGEQTSIIARWTNAAGKRDMRLTAVLIPAPEGGLTAFNPETGTTTQGETIEEALANLREATSLYLEEFPVVGAGEPLVTTFEVEARG